MDEANGKLAGQFGLKKTIDKEAGKLTFTADTLPTSAITGTLEIGETSTEGAAFVDGIIEPTSVPAKTDVEYTYSSAVKIGNIMTNDAGPKYGLFMTRLDSVTSNSANQYIQCLIPLGKYTGLAPNEPIIAFGTEDGTFYYPLTHITCEFAAAGTIADHVWIKNTDATAHTVSGIIFFALQEATA